MFYRKTQLLISNYSKAADQQSCNSNISLFSIYTEIHFLIKTYVMIPVHEIAMGGGKKKIQKPSYSGYFWLISYLKTLGHFWTWNAQINTSVTVKQIV